LVGWLIKFIIPEEIYQYSGMTRRDAILLKSLEKN